MFVEYSSFSCVLKCTGNNVKTAGFRTALWNQSCHDLCSSSNARTTRDWQLKYHIIRDRYEVFSRAYTHIAQQILHSGLFTFMYLPSLLYQFHWITLSFRFRWGIYLNTVSNIIELSSKDPCDWFAKNTSVRPYIEMNAACKWHF